MNRRLYPTRVGPRLLAALGAVAALAAFGVLAQTPAPAPAPAPASAPTTAPTTAPAPAPAPAPASTPAASAPDGIAALEWLRGCWHGAVNQRDFREHWMPAAGGMMIGAGHTVMQGRTQDYQYLRLEARPDGIYYVAQPAGQKEQTFRLAGTTRDEASGAQIFTFDNVAGEFPQHIVYHRGGEGWLYAGIEGTLNGAERKVIYPMRHVSCESGELLRQ